jgi:hypothetical protein
VSCVEIGLRLLNWEISATGRAALTFLGNIDVNSFSEF